MLSLSSQTAVENRSFARAGQISLEHMLLCLNEQLSLQSTCAAIYLSKS